MVDYASLIQSESGGNWQAQNNERGAGGQSGHYGRLQFGHARLRDAMNAGIIPQGTTPEQFMSSPEMQVVVEQWHFNDIDRQAQRMGLDRYIGQTVGGTVITQDAIRAMAHLGGIGGAARFLESGGQYNPSDSFGTSLLDYARQHGAGGMGGSSAPQQSNALASMPAPDAVSMVPTPGSNSATFNALSGTAPTGPQTNALNVADFVQPVRRNALPLYGFAPGQSPFIPG